MIEKNNIFNKDMFNNLFILFILLSILDIFTTELVLKTVLYSYEGNIIIRYFMNIGFAHYVIFKGIGISIIYWIMKIFSIKYTKQAFIINYTMFFICLLYILVVLNNLSVWWLYG